MHHIQQAEQWKKESLEVAEKKKKILIGIKEEQIEQMVRTLCMISLTLSLEISLGTEKYFYR